MKKNTDRMLTFAKLFAGFLCNLNGSESVGLCLLQHLTIAVDEPCITLSLVHYQKANL